MPDLGDPTSYLQVQPGVPVWSADGEVIGTLEHVLADDEADVFDGIVLQVGDSLAGHRFADAEQLEGLYEGGVVLTLAAAAVGDLPEPTENPPVLSAQPDDTTPDGVGDKLRRAWQYLSGNY